MLPYSGASAPLFPLLPKPGRSGAPGKKNQGRGSCGDSTKQRRRAGPVCHHPRSLARWHTPLDDYVRHPEFKRKSRNCHTLSHRKLPPGHYQVESHSVCFIFDRVTKSFSEAARFVLSSESARIRLARSPVSDLIMCKSMRNCETLPRVTVPAIHDYYETAARFAFLNTYKLYVNFWS